jgi:hypothetical protein
MYLHKTYEQEGVLIANNKASDGAGIYVDGGYTTLRDSVSLINNTASGYYGGGALFLRGSVLLVPDTNLSLTVQKNWGNSGMD